MEKKDGPLSHSHSQDQGAAHENTTDHVGVLATRTADGGGRSGRGRSSRGGLCDGAMMVGGSRRRGRAARGGVNRSGHGRGGGGHSHRQRARRGAGRGGRAGGGQSAADACGDLGLRGALARSGSCQGLGDSSCERDGGRVGTHGEIGALWKVDCTVADSDGDAEENGSDHDEDTVEEHLDDWSQKSGMKSLEQSN